MHEQAATEATRRPLASALRIGVGFEAFVLILPPSFLLPDNLSKKGEWLRSLTKSKEQTFSPDLANAVDSQRQGLPYSFVHFLDAIFSPSVITSPLPCQVFDGALTMKFPTKQIEKYSGPPLRY